MSKTITVTLPATSNWTTVHPHLESDVGGYAKFMFYYVATRDAIQQVGEIDINDNGTSVQFDHEWTITPAGQSINVEFDISHFNGKRVFRYKTTSGSSSLTFKFNIDHTLG